MARKRKELFAHFEGKYDARLFGDGVEAAGGEFVDLVEICANCEENAPPCNCHANKDDDPDFECDLCDQWDCECGPEDRLFKVTYKKASK